LVLEFAAESPRASPSPLASLLAPDEPIILDEPFSPESSSATISSITPLASRVHLPVSSAASPMTFPHNSHRLTVPESPDLQEDSSEEVTPIPSPAPSPAPPSADTHLPVDIQESPAPSDSCASMPFNAMETQAFQLAQKVHVMIDSLKQTEGNSVGDLNRTLLFDITLSLFDQLVILLSSKTIENCQVINQVVSLVPLIEEELRKRSPQFPSFSLPSLTLPCRTASRRYTAHERRSIISR